MTSVSSHIANTLASHVEHVFGVMGNGNAYLLDAIERRPEILYTPMRHEAGAVVAADAFYRSSGRIAVATVTYGAGFTNALTALAESVQARVPLILVVGEAPTSGPRDWDVDQVGLATAVGASTFTVGTADVCGTTMAALDHALGRQEPVVLAIPYDLAVADAGELSAIPTPQLPKACDQLNHAAVSTVAAKLAASERPFLLAGRGAWRSNAGAQLGQLADATGAVTGSTALGRGIFPNTRFDLGVTGGFGAEGAMSTVREADVAVVFGAALNQFTMRFGDLFSPGTHVIQVDVRTGATHPRVDTYIQGDAAAVAAALTRQLGESQARSTSWRETLPFDSLRARGRGEGLAADGRLDPRSAASRLGELLPSDRVVVSDGGHFIGWANMYWPVASPDRMLMVGTAYQSIGLGLPSMVGAARAHPSSTIVLSSGDGGGLMALADLESAIRVTGGRGIAVVWNDAAYTAEVSLYGAKGLAEAPMLIPEVDFAALGRAFGAESIVVRTVDDLDALQGWSNRSPQERPFLLLDLRISKSIVAPYQEEIIRINS